MHVGQSREHNAEQEYGETNMLLGCQGNFV